MSARRFDLLDRLNSHLSMGPRKKSKPSEEAEPTKDTQNAELPSSQPESSKPTADTSSSKPVEAPSVPAATSQAIHIPLSSSLRPSTASNDPRAPQIETPNGSLTQASLANRKSWYGSWKGKAKPVAEVVKDNIPASPAQSSTPGVSGAERRGSAPNAPSPRRYMSGSQTPQSKAAALPASVSNLSVVSNQLKDDKPTEDKPKEGPAPGEDMNRKIVPDPPLPPDPVSKPVPDDKKDGADQGQPKEQQAATGGWFGWWSRPDGYVEKNGTDGAVESISDAQKKALPESPAEERKQPKMVEATPEPSAPAPSKDNQDQGTETKLTAATGSQTRSSWFGLWTTQQNAQAEPPKTAEALVDQSSTVASADASVQLPTSMKPSDPTATSENGSLASGKDSVKSLGRRKSTGWAFWSRESPDADSGDVHKQVGELAVADTPSQTHPEAAQFNEQEQAPPTEPPKDSLKSKAGSLRRGRGKDKEPLNKASAASTPAKGTPSGSPTRKSAELAAAVKQVVQESKKDTNLLLPEFRSTYSLFHQPSVWDQIRSYVLGNKDNTPSAHLHIAPTPPRIKKAIAIGIHGYFPSPIFQKVLGQPTGTSIRFSNCAAQAIKNWTDERGYECEIEKIALEGEGFIADRVDTLWKLLLNWIEHLRQADFILVACHSQGVPVAIMLVAKLIQFGCVSSARIGVCAMAGINLGPFAEYKTRLWGGSALELFDFSNPNSKVSQMYQHALEEVLRFGAKIIYVGSIDDQLVSMESSTFSTLTHPLIYRAVFIDGRLHTSDFLSNLIGFTLKLRNLGLSDHGLIRELSPAVAGSLYTGEGHSSLHNYLPIYELAVKHSLETTSLGKQVEPTIKKYQGPPGVKDANPFFLPWAMRGILEEEVVRKELGGEIEELLRLFEEWKPQSKGLKDVKFRLEAVRSKL